MSSQSLVGKGSPASPTHWVNTHEWRDGALVEIATHTGKSGIGDRTTPPALSGSYPLTSEEEAEVREEDDNKTAQEELAAVTAELEEQRLKFEEEEAHLQQLSDEALLFKVPHSPV